MKQFISIHSPVIIIRYNTVYYYDGGVKLEILEIAARDNLKRSLLITSVPLSPMSNLEWVGFNVLAGNLIFILVTQFNKL